MYSLQRKWFLILLLAIMPAALAAADQIIAKESIDVMKAAGCGDELIVAIIRSAKEVRIDTSVDGLIALKRAGYSDAIIRAIVERAPNSSPATAATPQLVAVSPQLVAVQGNNTIPLKNSGVVATFAQSKKNGEPMDTLKSVGIGVGAGVGTAVAIGATAGSAAGSVVPFAYPVASAWSALRTKTLKGFYYELISQTTSTVVLTTAATEFTIPLAVFNDGRYPIAEPVLIKLRVSEETRTRVAGIAKGEMKYSGLKGPQEPKATEPYQHETVQSQITKANNFATLKVAGLPTGEYAVGFLLDAKLLPEVLDFTVR
ncbi:MAG: hypothetical protein Q8Q12_07455 [bacterium]|nr:hypothetical protein [bacterium]